MNQALQQLQAIEDGFTMADEQALYVRFVQLWPARRDAETRQQLRDLVEAMRWARGDGH